MHDAIVVLERNNDGHPGRADGAPAELYQLHTTMLAHCITSCSHHWLVFCNCMQACKGVCSALAAEEWDAASRM